MPPTIKLPRIRCAVCGTLVERVRITFSPDDRIRTLSVWCHGDRDEMHITDADMSRWTLDERAQWEAISEGRIEGVAFANKKLAEMTGVGHAART